jgi:predicted nucleic acid-binding protein
MTYKAKDLSPDQKKVIEGLLGRAIAENEEISVRSEDVHASSDPDDDIFLASSQAAHAHYLATGNQKHFPARWIETRIVSARGFLDVVATIRGEQ